MTPGWLVHRADDLNHWTNPRKGRCWSRTLCLYDSELLCYESGDIKTRPTWKGSRRLNARVREALRGWPADLMPYRQEIRDLVDREDT